MLCAKLGWNLISVSGGDDENVKSVLHVTEDGQRTNIWSAHLSFKLKCAKN